MNIDVVTLEKDDWKTYVLIVCTLVFVLILTGLCIFQIAHSVIKPLRVLNSRMREILESKNLSEVTLVDENDTCMEINSLYVSFRSLLSDYKFI